MYKHLATLCTQTPGKLESNGNLVTPDHLNTMTIIIDSREQTPLEFPARFETPGGVLDVSTTTKGLVSGDYSIVGYEDTFAVERKTVPDLLGSITSGRPRFERELTRMRGCWFARLLIIGDLTEVGTPRVRSKMSANAVFGTLATYDVRYVPVVVVPDEETAADQIMTWGAYFVREIANRAERAAKLEELSY